MKSALRTFAGLGLLAALLVHVGGGAVLAALRLIDPPALVTALVLGLVGTGCGAWRWTLVSRGLGLHLSLAAAVADSYRAVFLNATLPGGVLGDVHRAVASGRSAGDVRLGVRAVGWERTAGQVVQMTLAVVVLSVLPSPVRSWMPWLAGALVVGLVLLARGGDGSGGGWAGRMRADLRDGVLARWPGIVLTSAGAVVAHVATFVVAARVAGVTAPLAQLVPLVLLALLAMGVPANVAGFGPREGVAAWAFAAAGLPAAQGVATAVVYGALVLAASLPGAAVLVLRRVGTRAATQVAPVAPAAVPVAHAAPAVPAPVAVPVPVVMDPFTAGIPTPRREGALVA